MPVAVNQAEIDALIAAPSETLSVEVKRWLDPNVPAHAAKIIKGVLALHNRNGGFFVIGFDDATLQPDIGNEPSNIRDRFHIDVIQGLVSRYAQEPFEVGVGYSPRGSIEHPVIVIAPGVKWPIAAKRDLMDGSTKLIAQHAIYFRSLNSSGVASSTEARAADWREITDICFGNREADIGAFFRRQLSSTDRAALANALQTLGLVVSPNVVSPTSPASPQVAQDWLLAGEQRFHSSFRARGFDSDATRQLLSFLHWEVSLVVDPPWPSRVPDRSFLSTVLGSNPRLTGWPIWLDARTSGTPENRPQVADRSWEALVYSQGGRGARLDFMKLNPSGKFYLWRVLQDDVSEQVRPGTVLDPVLVLLRVAEAIAVGLQIVRSLGEGEDPANRTLGFGFRWTGLTGRVLIPWANPMVLLIGEPRCQEDSITTFVSVPGDTPDGSIAPFVAEATRDLFALFEGEQIPPSVVEDLCRRLVERRVGF